MQTLVHILAAVAIASLMLQSGLESNIEDILGALRERVLLLRALLVNIVAVPLAAALICRALSLEEGVTTGIILMAVAPGVPFLPFAASRAKGGHLSLAIGLVFLFGIVSVVTAPFTAQLLLPAAERIELPAARFMFTLILFQLFPLALGLTLGYTYERMRAPLVWLMRLLFSISLAGVILAIVVPAVRAVAMLVGSRGLLAMLTVVVAALLLGWLAAGKNRTDRVTLALGSALRNPGMGALIATSSFGGTIVVPAVMAFILVQLVVTIPVGIYFKRELRDGKASGLPYHAPRTTP